MAARDARVKSISNERIFLKIVELFELLMQVLTLLEKMKSSIQDEIRVSISSSLNVQNLQSHWIEASFKVRLWYLAEALSCYPELSRKLPETHRNVIASLLRGQCSLSDVASETRHKWKTVSDSLEALRKLSIVETKAISDRRQVHRLTKEFAQKIGRALRRALMLS